MWRKQQHKRQKGFPAEMNFIADLDRAAIRQQHPYRDLQPPPISVDDRDRAVSPLGLAEDLKR